MNSLKKIAEMSQKLEQLKDSRSEFIENLLAAFERDHPEFIEHLKECGLDEDVIRLSEMVCGAVKAKFGIEISPEVNIL